MSSTLRNEIIACCIGFVVGGAGTMIALDSFPGSQHLHGHTHPIANPTDDEYHIHADFLIYLDHEQYDLADPKFMTTDEQELHTDAHLHDGNGKVMHVHAEGVTFREFLESLGFVFDETCIETPSGESYCETDANRLLFFANGEPAPLRDYVPVDDDRLLLYYGDPEDERILEYLESIPDDACYYSGTCPERGVAPPESCGLTCEL